jgi:NADPH-dependent curcumin reductase CurA
MREGEASSDHGPRGPAKVDAVKTRAWVLSARPDGRPTAEHFRLREVASPALGPGEVRVRNTYLTVSPAMRVRMSADTRGYLPAYPLDEPLAGAAIGEVIASYAAGLSKGDLVLHQLGCRDIAQGPAAEFERLPNSGPPPELFLAELGSSGFTAYSGLVTVAACQAGETLFVSGAAGAVGSAAVQVGKALGMRVIGSAGGPAKCELVLDLGADAAIDYKSAGTLLDKIAAAAPDGLDVYFDNVGGEHLDAALALARPHARFAISGMISSYNEERVTETLHNLNRIVTRRIRIEGFMPGTDIPHLRSAFRTQMWTWISGGQVRPLQSVRHGLESLPQAFCDLFAGGAVGKLLIRLA